jgi:hypothetical protein
MPAIEAVTPKINEVTSIAVNTGLQRNLLKSAWKW